MRKWIRQQLLKRGWMMVRVPKKEMHINLTAQVVREVNELIQSFSKQTRIPELKNAQSILAYLTVERRQLFHDLVDRALLFNVRFQGKKIADVGTGTGYLLRVLTDKGPHSMKGFDTYEAMLDLAGRIAPDADFEARSLFEIRETFQVIFCMEVLEHMVDPNAGVRHLWSLVKPGGSLILSVPNGRMDFQASGPIREDGASYWGHIHFWSPESWALFLKGCIPDYHSLDTGGFGVKHLFAIIHKSEQ